MIEEVDSRLVYPAADVLAQANIPIRMPALTGDGETANLEVAGPPSGGIDGFIASGGVYGFYISGLPTAAEVDDAVRRAAFDWAASRPDLPNQGVIVPGEIYRFDGEMWRVLQQHNRAVFGGNPSQYPALIRMLRNPWVAYPWKQPIDQWDAYRKVNPLSGQADRCLFETGGVVRRYRVEQADGAGNNVWPPAGPGAFGWVLD